MAILQQLVVEDLMLQQLLLLKLFNADSCEIYTDVDGVFSTDPNKIPVAKKIERISYDEMLELSSLGAKVMQSSAVQTAMMYDIPLKSDQHLQIEKAQLYLIKKILIIPKVLLELLILKMMLKLLLLALKTNLE